MDVLLIVKGEEDMQGTERESDAEKDEVRTEESFYLERNGKNGSGSVFYSPSLLYAVLETVRSKRGEVARIHQCTYIRFPQ